LLVLKTSDIISVVSVRILPKRALLWLTMFSDIALRTLWATLVGPGIISSVSSISKKPPD
jgi:hypothetical protein